MSLPHEPSTPARPAARVLASILTIGLTLGLVFTSGVAAQAADEALAVTGLRTDGRTNPLGIGLTDPTFSWRNTATGRGVTQTAYEVEVSKGGSVVWSSGRVESSNQLTVDYDGPALTDQSRYTWRVKTWDNRDNASDWSAPASFETGLTNWTADWIAAPSDAAELARWNDYTVTTEFTMDNLVLGVYFRGINVNNNYMWQLSVADGGVKFRPHKAINGGLGLMQNIDISSFITKQELLTGSHTLKIEAIGSTVKTWLDDDLINTRSDVNQRTTGYVGFRQGNSTEGLEKSTIHSMNVTKPDGTVLLDTSFDSPENPFTVGRIAGGNLIFDTPSDGFLNTAKNLPVFRTDFATASGKEIASARVYAAARGVYELTLNGEKVGDQYLAPGWTDYTKRIQYQTYDVTDQVEAGANAFGALLAPGWYSGRIASFGNNKYGTTPSVIAQLRIDYTDGSSEWVRTDNTWKTTPGPIRTSDIIDGETYDARAELEGWDAAGYNASTWSTPSLQPTASAVLKPQLDEPVRELMQKPALVHTEAAAGKHVYDLGQNMVGIARLRLTGVAGQKVTIRYGEVLNPDGTLYVANLRSAKVTDYYTFAETGTVTWEPKFTYHGFRYVEVAGTSVAPALADITGLVWGSDLSETGALETSSPLLNQLQSNIAWGQRGNFLSIPTDTPARDERLGWTGDINVFAQTAAYNSDTQAFLTKWLVDLRDTQGGNGDLPGVAPYVTCCGGGVGWSDAGITVPYSLFKAFGDTSVVEENWDMMDRFMNYSITEAGTDNIGTRAGYLDWLHLDDPTPASVLATAYNAENARMLSEMAAATGRTAKAAQLSQLSTDIRAAFASTLIAANGTVSGNSQTAYAIALGMGMVPSDKVQLVGDRFVAKLALTDNHLTTGFLGTPWLLPALTASGHNDIAYEMLTHTDYPSWGYEIANGATTIWERWNSIMPDGTFGDVEMNSFNHYAYGAVGTWMYENVGGIAPLAPGYRSTRIAPIVGGGLTHASGSIDSVYGPISTDWETTANGLNLDVTVPVGTTAEVVLPAASQWAVSEGGALLGDVDGVTDVATTAGTVTVTVGSGTYSFIVDERAATLGAVFSALDDYRDEVARLDGLGDLPGGLAGSLGDGIDAIETDATTALSAIVAGGDVLSPLLDAVDEVAALDALIRGADVDPAVRTPLLDSNTAVDGLLGDVVSALAKVAVAIAPVAGTPLAGDEVAASVSVTNDGTAAISDLVATVGIEGGWAVAPGSLEQASLAAGAATSLDFSTTVPTDAEVGAVDATLAFSYVLDGREVHVWSTERLLTVASPISIGTATAELTGPGRGTVTATVSNSGTTGVAGRLALGLPEGWAAAVPSGDVTVPAGETTTISLPFLAPLTVNDGSFTIATSFVRGTTTLATKNATLAISLTRTPTNAIDWVDLGNTAAEASRGILTSGNGGVSSEAGLSRRYSGAGTPGSWFSFTINVNQGQPFILRATETYDSVATKKYDIKVDGTVVHSRQNTSKGAGTQTYDVLVPASAATSGTVRVEMRFTTQTGFHDPSVADVWTLPAPADVAPLVSANVTAEGPNGSNGWVRGPATVTVQAYDDSGTAPTIEVAEGDEWAAYSAPLAVTAQGTTTIGYRASDATGHTTDRKNVVVRLDSVAPVTTAETSVSADVATLDRATVTFSADDETSGVASTRYRIDGGAWTTAPATPVTVEGFGAHVVEFFSTDVAGNTGPVERTEIVVDDVDVIASLVAPSISGTAKYGKPLTANPGLWNTPGLTFSYQWLRNGVMIGNATASTYVVRANDGGKKVSVRVTASKAGLESVSAVTAATATVAKVTLLKNTKRPTISGTAKVGSTLTASKGSWNLSKWTFAYQWYRNGVAIPGATATKYKVVLADSGAKLTVRVGASTALQERVTATSVAKVVPKRASVTTFTSSASTVKAKVPVTLAIRVTSSGFTPSGSAYVWFDGKRIGTATITDGAGTFTLASGTKGNHSIAVTFVGTAQIAADKSPLRSLRII